MHGTRRHPGMLRRPWKAVQPSPAPEPSTSSASDGQPPSAPPPQSGSPDHLVNSGPTVFTVTLFGTAAGADSVVLLRETADCEANGLFRDGQGPPVAAGGAFALTVVTQRPRPCVRVAAVRAGRRGPAAVARVGPLAPRYFRSPPVAPDSARVDVVAPAR